MSWARPVPLVGDSTTAAQRRDDPSGWAFPPAARDALYAVLDGRRDIRRFRPDPIDATTLERVLKAAHAAPSVGHSQPWRFIVVQEGATREQAALMADRERCRQAAGMEPEAAQQLLDLQLEGIREAPVGLIVCCDRRVPASGVLGRSTFVDADIWSCACAIENLWLAARAEGLGTGWVTLFRPEELCALLALPEGVETLGWLCLGWPDERPPWPGLERAGWSRRQPLSDVVLFERWPADGPSPPISKLRAPAPSSVVEARDHADELLQCAGRAGYPRPRARPAGCAWPHDSHDGTARHCRCGPSGDPTWSVGLPGHRHPGSPRSNARRPVASAPPPPTRSAPLSSPSMPVSGARRLPERSTPGPPSGAAISLAVTVHFTAADVTLPRRRRSTPRPRPRRSGGVVALGGGRHR